MKLALTIEAAVNRLQNKAKGSVEGDDAQPRVRVIKVAPYQQRAARAVLEELERQGKPVPDLTRKIAGAKPKVKPGHKPRVRVIKVAPYQQRAARAVLEELERQGKPVPDLTRKIAGAKPKVKPRVDAQDSGA